LFFVFMRRKHVQEREHEEMAASCKKNYEVRAEALTSCSLCFMRRKHAQEREHEEKAASCKKNYEVRAEALTSCSLCFMRRKHAQERGSMKKGKFYLLLAGVLFLSVLFCGCQKNDVTGDGTAAEADINENTAGNFEDNKDAGEVAMDTGETSSGEAQSDQGIEKDLDPLIAKLRTYSDETMTQETYSSKVTGETYQLYNSSLPVLYINTEDDIFVNYSTASMYIMGNESCFDSSLLYEGEIEIKLRGNSTKYRDKSPYKIKLDTKTDLFGMGESKHWVLLANDIDHSLIRNKIVLDLAASIGMESTPASVLVSVILNGEYQGVYQLCEHIRVEEERVDIFNWEDLAEDAAEKMTEDVFRNLSQEESLKSVEDSTDESKDSAKEEDKTEQQAEEKEEIQEALEILLKEDYSWVSAEHTIFYKDRSYNVADYVTIPEADGGFLLEMDFYAFGDWELSTLITNFKQPFYFNTPEYVAEDSSLFQYAKTFLQSFEYSLHSNDFVYESSDTHYSGQGDRYDRRQNEWSGIITEADYTDTTFDDMHYTDFFDMDSLVNNFLICEFTMNWDSMKNSVFVSKDLGEKAEIGPVWDYDWAFGNVNMYNIDTYITDDWQTTNNYFTNEQYYQSVQWNRYLIKDPYFVMKVYEKYKEVRDSAIADTVASLDTYQESLAAAGAANDARWSYTYKDRRCYAGENSEDFEDSMIHLKKFITDRMAWLDDQFADFGTLINSLGAYEASNDLRISATIESKETITLQASVKDSSIKQVIFQVNGTTFATGNVSDSKAQVTIDKNILNNGMNMIVIHAADETGSYLLTHNEPEAQTISNYYLLQR